MIDDWILNAERGVGERTLPACILAHLAQGTGPPPERDRATSPPGGATPPARSAAGRVSHVLERSYQNASAAREENLNAE